MFPTCLLSAIGRALNPRGHFAPKAPTSREVVIEESQHLGLRYFPQGSHLTSQSVEAESLPHNLAPVPMCLLLQLSVALALHVYNRLHVRCERLGTHVCQLLTEGNQPSLDSVVHTSRVQRGTLDNHSEPVHAILAVQLGEHQVSKLLLGSKLIEGRRRGKMLAKLEAGMAMGVLARGSDPVQRVRDAISSTGLTSFKSYSKATACADPGGNSTTSIVGKSS